jgi:hypothetical protein
MPKYKMQIWLETADSGTCVVEAENEEDAREAVQNLMMSGDHGVIEWERSVDGGMEIEVAKEMPPETEADLVVDYEEEEDTDAQA